MKPIVRNFLAQPDRTIPILSFPSTQLLGVTVSALVRSGETQAAGMAAVAARCPMGASLNMMDLSVEAEAFGARVLFEEDEIPTVTAGILDDITDAYALEIPLVGSGRTGIYLDGVRLAKELIRDRPVFCGVIGPYSLAGRLFDMTELMMSCYDDPDGVKALADKCASFLIAYIQAFKAVGADGVMLAEPAAGLLSPALCEEFSSAFVRRIRLETFGEDFVFCYHNCGNRTPACAQSIAAIGADVYHFGNAVELADLLPRMPADSLVMGNVDPVLFKNGSPDDIREATRAVYEKCRRYPNFMLSSGCDIPAGAKWENLDAYFETVQTLYRDGRQV